MDRRTEATSAQTISVPSGAPPASVSHLSQSSLVEEGRFISGTLLAGRYRIVGLQGKGGMGEVYRATDLTLGQSVALKFLPAAVAGAGKDNRFLLERFHGEVRIARQISHPNVCRVYDIGEVDGMPFISMEYIDGEDLASLLPRIGRLPADKAIETARRICAGLAAAHARGVIHRDLKPHNIMMNKRGEIVIMDFGLAAIADQLSGAEARNGTPAYMSPEQLKGTEVTARSDIYALGLVLYELFTGRRPFEAKNVALLIELQEAAQLTSMTSIAADIDPAVENVIRRCLDPDPQKRPENALLVAAALPGGDPLAAALAAGETPSPELVAAAGKTEGMPVKYALGCLAAVLICVAATPLLKQQKAAFLQTTTDYPPDVLRQKGRDIAASFGYAQRPADSELWLNQRVELITYLDLLPQPRKWSEWLNSEAPVSAIYRESLEPMVATPDGGVTESDPPVTEPGMTEIVLDAQGRLRGFLGVPVRQPPGAPVSVDAVFKAAQLDAARFTEVSPVTVPPVPADRLQAWEGLHPAIPGLRLHIEIASWQGRVSYVKFRWPWTKDSGPAHFNAWISEVQEMLLPVITVLLLAFAVLLARRNWRLGRGDRRGAFVVGMTMFTLNLLNWAASVHAVPTRAMLGLSFEAVSGSTFKGALFLVMYLALEPALRARWPHSIITWNRALAGRWKDAQLASDILIGMTVGALIWAAVTIRDVSVVQREGLDTMGGLYLLNGTRYWITGTLGRFSDGITTGIVIFFAIFILRTLLRRDWIAAIAGALIFSSQQQDLANALDWQVQLVVYILLFSVIIFVMLRLGLVATIASIFAINLINGITLGTDWTTWYAPTGLATMLMATAVAGWAFRQSLGDRELV
jgi:serine/threonine-protein kinase